MVNTAEFAERLNKILEFYEISAASFADKIDVGRSSISHILSGRNKPSLDFVMKVVKSFPEVELYWLLNGKGSFPKTEASASTTSQNPSEEIKKNEKDSEPVSSIQNLPKNHSATKSISKIVIFYEDGSFEAFAN
ncbi:helix-turn-helix domain-containing protein [Salegentibacter sp. HM20]